MQMNASISGILEEDTLTDEQIRELLHGAGDRLKGLRNPEPKGSSLPTAGAQHQPIFCSRLDPGNVVKPYISTHGEVVRADSSRLLDDRERQLSNENRLVNSPVSLKCVVNKSRKATAGSDWFDLPRTIITPELKRDLQLLKMRSVLDPKRHYKKDHGRAKEPEFSQMGMILEGPTDFYSSRLFKKHRKNTLLGEVLAGEVVTNRFKSKYGKIQSMKASGKKAHYRGLVTKRSRGIRK